MGKKQKAEGGRQLSVNSGQLPVVEEARELPYLLGTWKSVDHYRCRECSFDSFQKMSMLRHLVDKHNSEDALAMLVELEGATPSVAARHLPQIAEERNLGEKEQDEVFEVELKEIGTTVDAQGNEHKTFAIKE